MATKIGYFKAFWLFIKQRWLAMLVLASTFAFIGGYLSLTQQINQERAVNNERARAAVEQVREAIDENGDLTREGVELLTCLVLLNGGQSDGVNVNKDNCRRVLSGTNNLDGTFTSGGINDSAPRPQPTEHKEAPPTPNPGLLQQLLNTIGI